MKDIRGWQLGGGSYDSSYYKMEDKTAAMQMRFVNAVVSVSCYVNDSKIDMLRWSDVRWFTSTKSLIDR